ncbi:hypothetical protein D3C85_1917420 [compost metagenome]
MVHIVRQHQRLQLEIRLPQVGGCEGEAQRVILTLHEKILRRNLLIRRPMIHDLLQEVRKTLLFPDGRRP